MENENEKLQKIKNLQALQNACAMTGHRKLDGDFSLKKLEQIFVSLIKEKGVTRFYNGMAYGFDLTACELLVKLRKKYKDIKIIACVPCPEQADRWLLDTKKKYEQLLSACDEKIVLSPHYTKACMHVRNRYMVDNARYLVAYCNSEKGGTASTVGYARKENREIIFVNE